jgi:hypothetical protein
MRRLRALALVVGLAGASCAELLGIESATVDASLVVDAADAADAEANDASAGVRCGDMSCKGSKPICCFAGMAIIDGSTGLPTCATIDADTAMGNMCVTALHCDDQAECGDSGVCCLTSTVDGSVSQCSPSCAASIMCDPTVDGGCECTGTVTFKSESYSICADQ